MITCPPLSEARSDDLMLLASDEISLEVMKCTLVGILLNWTDFSRFKEEFSPGPVLAPTLEEED